MTSLIFLMALVLTPTQPLGKLSFQEIRQIEDLSYQISMQNFVEKEKSAALGKKVSAALSLPILFKLTTGTALIAFNSSKKINHCRSFLFRLGRRFLKTGGMGLMVWAGVDQYFIWTADPDSELDWLKDQNQKGAFKKDAQENLRKQLMQIQAQALARSFKDQNVKIEVVIRIPQNLWSGFAEEAYIIWKDETGLNQEWQLKAQRILDPQRTTAFYWHRISLTN